MRYKNTRIARLRLAGYPSPALKGEASRQFSVISVSLLQQLHRWLCEQPITETFQRVSMGQLIIQDGQFAILTDETVQADSERVTVKSPVPALMFILPAMQVPVDRLIGAMWQFPESDFNDCWNKLPVEEV